MNDDDLSRLIRSHATHHRPPPSLAASLQTEITMQSLARRPVRTRWSWLPQLASFAGGALACLLVLAWVHPAMLSVNAGLAQETMVSEAQSSHVRSLMVSHLTDVASTDQHTVKPWFQGKLDYAPPVQDLAASGFPLIGGRLDYLATRPVAALVYRRNAHVINLFVWPMPGANASASVLARQGYHVLTWRKDGMQFMAVSDVNEAELSAFGRLLH